jgi:hypothetical protein
MNQENQQSQQSCLPVPSPSGSLPSENSNLPVVASQDVSAEEAALRKFASAEPSFATSLPTVTSEDIERLSTLMAVSDAKTKNCAGQTLEVVGFAVDFGNVGETADGEVVEGLRGHMLLSNGKSVFTTSKGILKALRDGMKIYGSGLWTPPVLLEIRAVASKRGDALIGVWRGRAKDGQAKAKK